MTLDWRRRSQWTCNGRKMHVRQGSVRVTLNRRASHLACEFRSSLAVLRTSPRKRRELNGRHVSRSRTSEITNPETGYTI